MGAARRPLTAVPHRCSCHPAVAAMSAQGLLLDASAYQVEPQQNGLIAGHCWSTALHWQRTCANRLRVVWIFGRHHKRIMSCAQAVRTLSVLLRRGLSVSAAPLETVSYAISRTSPQLYKDKSKLILDESFDLKQPFPVAQTAASVGRLEVTLPFPGKYSPTLSGESETPAIAYLSEMCERCCILSKAATSHASSPTVRRTACRHSRDLWTPVHFWGADQLRQV